MLCDVRWGLHPMQESPNSSRTQSDPFPDRAHPKTFPPKFQDLGAEGRVCLLQLPSPRVLLFRPDSFDAGLNPLLNHCAFKFTEHSHHPEERLARRRGGVDTLLMNKEVNFLRVDLGLEIDQVSAPKHPIIMLA